MAKYNWMKVVDVMTKDPLTIAPSETVGEAEELMAENGIRQLPVVENRELVGIITDRDVRSFLAGGSSLLATNEREQSLGTKVSDLMTTDPLTLEPDDELQNAVVLLVEQKVGGVPVVDAKEGLVGIVTYVDVLRCFLNRLQEE